MRLKPPRLARTGVLPALGLALIALLVATSAALAAGGELDPSFGDGGKVIVGGAIYVAGESDPDRGSSDFALAKLRDNGRPAKRFGSRGRVLTDFGRSDAASAVAVAPTGEVILAGTSGNRYNPRLALARYLP